MSQTYARGGHDDTAAGRIILMITSSLAAILVVAGLIYAAGIGPRHQAALAAAGCEPNLSPAGLPCTTAAMLTSRFKAIVTPAGQQLSTDEAAYTASQTHDLAAAQAALKAEVNSDKAFGAALAGLRFPVAIAPMARTLARDNQARATLTAEQARSSSLTQLRSFNTRVQAANATAQAGTQLILKALTASAAAPKPSG